VRGGRGCYPGSFNPPTVAHLAIAHAAWSQAELDVVELVVSRLALGKEAVEVPTLDDRVALLETIAATRPWLTVRVTDDRLLVDVARGSDVLVMGADKWAQVRDPAWYGSVAARDAAVRALPRVLVAPRPGFDTDRAEVLRLVHDHGHVSSSAARDGEHALMLDEAIAFDRATGAWSDPSRYRATRGLPA
jgi:nicotinic acid mononucleotide adenylyltransferase